MADDLRAEIEALDAWLSENQYAHFDEDERDMGPCVLVADLRALLAAHPVQDTTAEEGTDHE